MNMLEKIRKYIPMEAIHPIIACLDRRREIVFAMIYGSALEGESYRDLDIGLFVDRSQVPSLEDFDFVCSILEELESPVTMPIDMHVINDAPLGFRYNVSHGVPMVIHDKEAYYHFLERTWDEYHDFAPVAMKYLQEMK